MRSAQVLAVRAALLGLVLASAGCFRPKILPGGFACGDAGVGVSGLCPDGLLCDPGSHTCVSSIGGAGGRATGGAGGKGGQGGQGGQAGKAGMDGGVRDMGVDYPCLAPPMASCQSSDAGMCDPVCNTGCGHCYEKCSVNTSGALTCNAQCKVINGTTTCPLPPATPLPGLLQLCDQFTHDSLPTDDCAAGQVCLAANACGSRCYQFCRTNTDCPTNATCSKDVGGGNSVCDVPTMTCDPVNGAARTPSTSGCPGTTSCYLSATSGNTLCDCQNNRTDTKNGAPGDPCVRSRDCFGGLVCIDPTSTSTMKFCYKVCRLPGADGGVDAGTGEIGCVTSSCSPILLPDGTTNPTYGFCNE